MELIIQQIKGVRNNIKKQEIYIDNLYNYEIYCKITIEDDTFNKRRILRFH